MNEIQKTLTSQKKTTRQVELDILRGFSLLGILMVNYEYLSMPDTGASISYHLQAFPGILDRIAAWLIQFLFDGKFILLFSLLFGYGFQIQVLRAKEKGIPLWKNYSRRLFGLIFFGLIHAVFFFVGDILVTYALLGFLLIFFQNASPKKLLLSSFFFWLLAIGCHTLLGWLIVTFPEEGTQTINQIIAIYREGSFTEILKQRVFFELIPLYILTPFLFAPQVFGMFLFGLFLAKSNLWKDFQTEYPHWKKVFRYSFPIALFGNIFYASLIESGVANHFTSIGGMAGRAIFTPFGALAYLSGFAILLRSPKQNKLFSFFESGGKISLTLYLSESIFCGFIFYSYGLGFFGSIGPAFGILLCLVVYTILICLGRWWLHYFAIGPLEWILRSWTYGTLQNLRREKQNG